jgi:hypothetical protein
VTTITFPKRSGAPDQYQLAIELQGARGVHYSRGDVDAARSIAQESMTLAQSSNDPELLRHAHCAMGATLQLAGGKFGLTAFVTNSSIILRSQRRSAHNG